MVKFRDTAGADVRAEVIRELSTRFPGSAFDPVFAGEEDPELASLFVLKLPAGSSIDAAALQLSKSPSVEYTHRPQPRKPK